MAVIMTALWDNIGTVIPIGAAEYVVAEQPIAEYDNWFNYNIVADVQAVIDDVINKFDANTILKADTDNTPAALVVAEQTMVGRKTGGSITSLTVAEVLALIGVSSGAEANVFEETTNVLREKSTGGYDNDFVIGSPTLDRDADAGTWSRMFFDKGKSSFRGGVATSTQWDAVNVGDYSFGVGHNTIASGDYSFGVGRNTIASGEASCADGISTNATAPISHSAGEQSIAYLNAQYAKAAGKFSSIGDAQYSDTILRKETIDAFQTELTIDGGIPDSGSRLILPANRTWAFTINIAARRTGGTAGAAGDSGIYKIEGGIKRDGSNVTELVGVITKTVIAEEQSAWDVTAEADNTNECLVIKVTGATNNTIHWTAKVDLVEVG